MNITTPVLIRAPLAMKKVIELIISISEYKDTPIVAAKNPRALTITDGIAFEWATLTASLALRPLLRSLL